MNIEMIKTDYSQLGMEVKILEKCYSDFCILNDNSYNNKENINAIIKEIEKYNYNVDLISIDDIMFKISNYLSENKDFFKDVNLIIAVGEGGERTLSALNRCDIFNNIEKRLIKWSRIWNGEKSNEFVTNIDTLDLNNKKILLIEDVIATGETLYNIVEKIKKMNGEVKGIISAVISGESPIKNKSFTHMLVGIEIDSNTKSKLNPFWYPPIYSLRHLIFGDSEMMDFYKSLNEKYFNNETNIENLIKERRNN